MENEKKYTADVDQNLELFIYKEEKKNMADEKYGVKWEIFFLNRRH